jgi:hypothetical protein
MHEVVSNNTLKNQIRRKSEREREREREREKERERKKRKKRKKEKKRKSFLNCVRVIEKLFVMFQKRI